MRVYSFILKGLLLVTFAYSASKLPSIMCFSNHERFTFPVRYFSMTKLAMGAAHLPPQYPFSTMTLRAIFGLSFGANAMNIEWSVSWVLTPLIHVKFSTVTVFQHTSIPCIDAMRAVPFFTTFAMPSITGSKCSFDMLANRFVLYLTAMKSP